MTPKEIIEGKIGKKLETNRPDLQASYQFCISGDNGGEWVVDVGEGKVFAGKKEDASCTITLADEDFVGLATGTVQGPTLFMTGKLKISGDINLAMKLGDLLKG